ncbi:hypothetical protein FACS1894158_11940 [Betaproteobacteria bacterium]|nr:hypothetical protein FACS1894158_11940 [Betaproteobacteria bacterium]
MKHFELFVMALLLAFALSAEAGPAPWYKWQGSGGDVVCSQTSPGEGWTRIGAIYVDPRCMRRDNRATENERAKNKK